MLTGWGGLSVAVAAPPAAADCDGAAAGPQAATIPAPRAPSDRAPPARRRSRRVSVVAGFGCVSWFMSLPPLADSGHAGALPHLLIRIGRYDERHIGLRFSRNALTPSAASSESRASISVGKRMR